MDETPRDPATPDEPLDFGPGGYLPERASKRARKIVLRAPMGIQWVIGSLVVGVIVVIAGVIALSDGAPEAPYVMLGPADTGISVFGKDIDYQPLDERFGDLLIVGDGRPHVFVYEGDRPVLCEATGFLEAADGRSWRVTGRGLGGTPSLVEHPSVVYEGTLYADPTRTLPTPTPDEAPVEQGCAGVPGGTSSGTPTPLPPLEASEQP